MFNSAFGSSTYLQVCTIYLSVHTYMRTTEYVAIYTVRIQVQREREKERDPG